MRSEVIGNLDRAGFRPASRLTDFSSEANGTQTIHCGSQGVTMRSGQAFEKGYSLAGGFSAFSGFAVRSGLGLRSGLGPRSRRGPPCAGAAAPVLGAPSAGAAAASGRRPRFSVL